MSVPRVQALHFRGERRGAFCEQAGHREIAEFRMGEGQVKEIDELALWDAERFGEREGALIVLEALWHMAKVHQDGGQFTVLDVLDKLVTILHGERKGSLMKV